MKLVLVQRKTVVCVLPFTLILSLEEATVPFEITLITVLKETPCSSGFSEYVSSAQGYFDNFEPESLAQIPSSVIVSFSQVTVLLNLLLKLREKSMPFDEHILYTSTSEGLETKASFVILTPLFSYSQSRTAFSRLSVLL